MRLTIESKGDFSNTKAWMARVVNRSPVAELRKIAKDGEQALASNTPSDTGATAAGWTSEVTSVGGQSEVSWMNVAHPEQGVNIAKIIELGHGTGTGGYVPPRPYIKQSMDSVWNATADRIVEELMK